MPSPRKTSLAALFVCLAVAASCAVQARSDSTARGLISTAASLAYSSHRAAQGEYFPIFMGVTALLVTSALKQDGGQEGPAEEKERELEQKEFVHFNRQQLTLEMAAGGGPYLAVLGRMLGCPPAAAARFGRMAQREFAALLPAVEAGGPQLMRALSGRIAGSAGLAAACNPRGKAGRSADS